jgi:hypothetical protein
MDAIEQLFRLKSEEATRILAAKVAPEPEEASQSLPFEVNKVLGKIKEETARRAKLSKRKAPVDKKNDEY